MTRLTGLALALALFSCTAEETAPDSKPVPSAKAIFAIDPGTHDLNSFFECLEEEGITLAAAHRGGAYPGLPENSLETMKTLIADAPMLLEIDVAATKDNRLILMHDDTLDRTTNGSGDVSRTNWADIQGLVLEDNDGKKTDHKVPLLSDVIDWADGKTILQIDIKNSVRYEDLVSLVREKGAEDRVVYITYTTGQARVLHRLHPEVMLSVSIDGIEDIGDLAGAGLKTDDMIAWTGNERPNPAVFRMLNNQDIEVIFGTLGGADSIDNLIADSGSDERYADIAAMGIDILSTDRPLEVIGALGKDKTVEALATCKG